MALTPPHAAAVVPETRAAARSRAPLKAALIRQLMAAGQADIVIGIPTFNHASSVGPLLQTVNRLFNTVYTRKRTVLINPDGGSTDGTQQIVQSNGLLAGESTITPFGLRTVHHITTPYQGGVLGRGGALRLIFAAADLLGARAVAVIDPESNALAIEDLVHFLKPVLDGGADYVKPVWARAPAEGPLVTQFVRPLLRAMLGQRLLEPIDPLLGCSGAFASKALQADVWDTQDALDPWLLAVATRERMRLAQVAMPASAAHRAHAEFAELFRRVVGSVLAVIAKYAEHWLSIRGSQSVQCSGEVGTPSSTAPPFATQSYANAYREGIDVLRPILVTVLARDTLDALEAAARGPELRLDDALWVRVVYEVVACACRRTISFDQLAQCLQPIYLGRLCSLLDELARDTGSSSLERHERLALAFEQHKPERLTDRPVSL